MFGLAKAFGRLNVAAGVTKSVYTASAVSRLHTTAQRYQQSSKPPTADQTASSAFDIAEEASGSGPAAASEYRIVSAGKGQGTVKIREYEYSTANFHVSPQKLRMIGNQITGLTVTEAIRQMQFSAKKASDRIKHSLVWARKNAIFQKGMNPDNMYIKQARVGKGQFRKRLDPKARGRFGVIHIPYAHMKYVFWEKMPEAKPEPRNVMEKALLAGDLPRRKIKGFKLTKRVWTPLNETKPVYNAKQFYNW